MSDEANWLLSARLAEVARRVAATSEGPLAEAAWSDADAALREAGAAEEAEVALPVLVRSLPDLEALLAAWAARRTPLPAWDKAVLARAMKALKRRLDLTRGDDDVSSSRNPLTRGASSSITGVRPPERYPPEVWATLVAHGRLRDAGDGVLEPTGT